MSLPSGSDPPNEIRYVVNKKRRFDSNDDDEDDETVNCIICSEAWTDRGDHCLVSLQCGHLFGRKCIERWIFDKARKSNSKKAVCPMCMKAARESDIRIVKPLKIAVKDTSQIDLLKKELEDLKAKIKENENALDLSRLSLNLHKKELERAKERQSRKIATTTTDSSLQINTTNQPSLPSSQQSNNSIMTTTTAKVLLEFNDINVTKDNEQDTHIPNQPSTTDIPKLRQYSIYKSKKLSESRHVARVMALDQSSSLAYISFKPSKNEHGILKLNLIDIETTDYLGIHDGLVRDIRYSSQHPDLILSTSMDKSLKITSTKTNTVEQSILLSTAGWSCSFDSFDPNKIYCGLADSTVLVYDLRNTHIALDQLKFPDITKTPLHSLSSKRIYGKNILCCSNLDQAFIWDNSNNQYCKLLNIERGFKPFSLSVHHGSTNGLLLSSRNSTSTKHQLLKLQQDYTTTIFATLNPPQLAQKSLTRTCSYSIDPNDNDIQHSMICYSNEVKGTLCLSSTTATNQVELQQFQIRNCPLDIQLYDQHKLAFLTDNRFFLLNKKE
ncbi:MAG: hypothetical protein EXX96DRAFT_550914 [Benjaminiella poitrasii]|nr:MAG: hypothetical protein EXX96DRAFT_550914 [Benjaminiella poitrasii]